VTFNGKAMIQSKCTTLVPVMKPDNMKGNKVKITKEKILYKGWSVLKEYEIEYAFETGMRSNLMREIYNSGDGAAALLYNPDKKCVLLVRQFRLAAFVNGHPDGFLLESCAGMLDDKDPAEAVKKEIEEETGYRVSEVHKIGEVYATPGAHMEKIHLYTARYNDFMKATDGGGNVDEAEEIILIEYSYDQVRDMVSNGQIEDAKTLILLQHCLLNHIS
jgi:GDP-mannose pyrophosphatase NudK